MALGISIEKPAEHTLVLGFVLSRLVFKKLNAPLAQGYGYLYSFIPED
jgi:hypothetical protein